jgi:hypothetical protein
MNLVLRSGDTPQLVCQRDIKTQLLCMDPADSVPPPHVLSVTRARDKFLLLPVRPAWRL